MKIKTSLLVSYAIIIGLTLLLSIFLVIAFSNIENRYRIVSENMILEYEITGTFSKLVDSYTSLLQNDDNFKKYRATYDESSNTLNEIFTKLDTVIIFPQSKEIYTRIKNISTSIKSDCDINLSDPSTNRSLKGTGIYDRAIRGKEYIRENTANLILKELEYSKSIQKRLSFLRMITLVSSLVLIVLIIFGSGLYGIKFSNKLSGTILKLTQTAETISQGNLNLKVGADLLQRKDEIGSLSNSFQIMLTKLIDTIYQIDAQKDLVEAKVVERTHELQEKNVSLEKAKEEISAGWLLQQKEKARLSASINSFILGFILTDTSDQVVDINPSALTILGIKPPVTMKTIETVLKDTCDLHILHEQCLKDKKVVDIKNVAFGAKFLHMMISPILLTSTEKSECLGTALLIDDITEAKVLERSRDEFFSIASHELRTPLTAIMGNTSMVLDYYKEVLKDPELKTMITDTHEASIRLIGIVNDFLDVSRLEQGKVQYTIADVKVVEVVNKVIKNLAENAKAKGVELVVSGDEKILVKADVGRVEQILFNVVGNSLKFTEKGSVKIEIVADTEKKMAKILITDTGIGIPLANQSILFHKFQQAGSSLITRDGAKGTGLGLYISRLMAEGMGGKLELISSEEGRGSVFAISLTIA